MYRILRAVNGYYYVQRKVSFGYKKIGGFFLSVRAARNFIDSVRGCRIVCPPCVVEYR